jgi:transketolase
VEVPSGSLGQGFSAGLGIALGLRHLGKQARVYTVIGDGELQEGQSWEVVLAAGAKNLDNFVTVLDYNGIQQDGFTKDILPLDRVEEKFQAFDWAAVTIDGHSVEELIDALSWADSVTSRPAVVVARTVKGYGVSYMENQPSWHGTKPPSDDLYEQAIRELERREEQIDD